MVCHGQPNTFPSRRELEIKTLSANFFLMTKESIFPLRALTQICPISSGSLPKSHLLLPVA
ncbi:hypothetical protein BDP55DRAFT_671501 [Colletotrichum godetiae]|uniref:Uncharacterized protein n=1 Tax=Colletotrichum godetiae TaxID=1209918 RepID=A0AAJ0AFJ0_9PEZI|nr:uncharacterized protein BDP55DRAFT_671501 [Colletotrichum godetiae]KAK1672956.1 hypothetical protein BDP55DRAFT_671501 [Colletotrichum godetiae]